MAVKTIKQEAREKLWRMGVLSYKLHSGQREIYELYRKNDSKLQVWLLSRRFGKSYALCLLAIEECLRAPNSIVKFVSPTKLQVNTNVRPIFRKILEDCPEDLMPNFNSKDYIFYFPNGSEIQLAGTNSGHAEKLRGGNSTVAFVDEAGDCSDLDNIVKSILIPTTLLTKGKIILSGTPPKEPDHDYVNFIEDAESKNALIKKTIYENPQLTQKDIQEAFEDLGGEFTDASRREYLCEIIRDPKTSVIPEFTKELEADIVKEWKKPPHYDMYESMDLGFKDLTAILYAYYDFRNNKVIIEDESSVDFKITGTTLDTLVKTIKDTEYARFFNHLTNEQVKPFKRVSDGDYIITNEISIKSGREIRFDQAKKDNLDAMINFLREKLKKQEIVIHPRCVNLLRHLRNVKWKKGDKSAFARSPDDSHYDFVASLMYLVRVIDYRKNPYPAHYGRDMRDLQVYNDEKFYQRSSMDVYKKIFNIKKR